MKKSKFIINALIASVIVAGFQSCKDDDDGYLTETIHDVNTAEKESIDRFSATAGHLQVRTSSNGLPAANAPVNFDQAPFITKGKGPLGQMVEYYNFDVQSTTAAPIYVLFREGDTNPVEGQFNIVNVIPGDADYNDFWQIHKVTVPASYKANQVASFAEIQNAQFKIEATDDIVNCPVVPNGSTATKRLGGGSAELTKGWYNGKVVFYFNFFEKSQTLVRGKVPTVLIYVTFNINPDLPEGGPASGFKSEPGTSNTHNVVAALPSDESYSPLWLVNAYDNAEFDDVSNLATAEAAESKGTGLAIVNCPIVTINN